jgi:hypothetical protein
VHKVYLYDDKYVAFYNLPGGGQVSYIDVCDDMEGLEPLENTGLGCSDSVPPSPPDY